MASYLTRREPRTFSQQSGALDPFRLMREMMRWDPFRDLEPGFAGSREELFIPAFNVTESADGYVFRADLPGVKQDDLDISVSGNRLTISGKRETEQLGEGEAYLACECTTGTFTRTFTLPEGTSPDEVTAELKDGVLTVKVGKAPEVKAKRINVRTGDGSAAKEVRAQTQPSSSGASTGTAAPR